MNSGRGHRAKTSATGTDPHAAAPATASPASPASAASAASAAARQALRADIESCGYFPELVEDAITLAVGAEDLVDYVVHHQPTFTHDEVHRHITVLARTGTRLVIGHTDDHPAEQSDELPVTEVMVSSSTESVPLHKINTVALTRVVPHPEHTPAGSAAVETWLSITWGAVRRVDLEPATCGDPSCDADHGFTGTLVADDLTMRMSSAADGADSVDRLAAFGTALQQVTGRTAAG